MDNSAPKNLLEDKNRRIYVTSRYSSCIITAHSLVSRFFWISNPQSQLIKVSENRVRGGAAWARGGMGHGRHGPEAPMRGALRHRAAGGISHLRRRHSIKGTPPPLPSPTHYAGNGEVLRLMTWWLRERKIHELPSLLEYFVSRKDSPHYTKYTE